MLDGQFQDMGALLRLVMYAALCGPMALWMLWRARGESRLFEGLGLALLAVLVVVLPPLHTWNMMTGETLVWMFGAQEIDTGVVEFATSGMFMAGAVLAGLLALRGNGWTRIAYGLGALGAFVIGGEELSWGQWIFHWQTPEAISAGNLQHETNLHNFVTPGGHEEAYALAGAVLLAATVALYFRRFRLPALLAPGAFLRTSRFAPALAVVAATMMQHPFFQELAELAVAATLVYGLAANLTQRPLAEAAEPTPIAATA